MPEGTELAKAYVQILPSMEGIKQNLSKGMNSAAAEAGETAGKESGNAFASKFGAIVKAGIAALGIGKLIKASIAEAGDLEQSIGGVETLFGEDAMTVIENANQAFKTAGVSANTYMQQVTSFSASLLQSLNGDTAAAAQAADTALKDMSDNANKFGTDIQSIQNAYQGFAKQNFTMLDNLKLGYGGTKTEMERLLAEATAISGVEYDITNLNDIYSAIHEIQNELGVTGTTAVEAATTISGSLGMLKASWQNTLAALSGQGELSTALSGVFSSVGSVITQLIPSVSAAVTQLIPTLTVAIQELAPGIISAVVAAFPTMVTGITAALPMLLRMILVQIPAILRGIAGMVPEIVPALLDGIIGILDAVLDNLPAIIQTIIDVIPTITESVSAAIAEAFPEILTAVIDIVLMLIDNLPDLIQMLVDQIPTIVSTIVEVLVSNTPAILGGIIQIIASIILNLPKMLMSIWDSLFNWIGGMVTGIINAAPRFVSSVSIVANKVWITLKEKWKNFIEWIKGLPEQIITKLKNGFARIDTVGLNLIKGLWNGISNAYNWLIGKIKGFTSGVLDSIKGFFGVHSPSTEFAYIGEMLDKGLAVGVADNTAVVTRAMDDLAASTVRELDSGIGVGVAASLDTDINTAVNGSEGLVSELNKLLSNLVVVLDSGEVVGGISTKMDKALGSAGDLAMRGVI